jgi:hypothetical protein
MTSSSGRDRNDVISDAMRLIKAKRQEECFSEIEICISLLLKIKHAHETLPSRGNMKKEFEDILRVLRSTRRSFKSISESSRMIISQLTPKYFSEVDQLIHFFEGLRNSVPVPHGSREWDNTKAFAAKYAAELLLKFKKKLPKKTVGGTFYNLASLLYEGAGGKFNEDLQTYCREIKIAKGRKVVIRFKKGNVIFLPLTDK